MNTFLGILGGIIGVWVTLLLFGVDLFVGFNLTNLIISAIISIAFVMLGNLFMYNKIEIATKQKEPQKVLGEVAVKQKERQVAFGSMKNSPSAGYSMSDILPSSQSTPVEEEFERPKTTIVNSEQSRQAKETDIRMVREIINEHKRRLRALQMQEAKQGISSDPSITLEIEDVTRKINELTQELQNLDHE